MAKPAGNIHTLLDERTGDKPLPDGDKLFPGQGRRLGSDGDKPLPGNADAKRNDEGIHKPPTGNINYSFEGQGKRIGHPENSSDRDKPLAGNAANQPNAQFDDGDAKRNDEGITKPPTGNINKGPGAGAINGGKNAGAIIRHKDEINFKPSKDDSEVSVPSDGNINRGPGAGAVNSGEGAGSIVDCKGPINF